MTKSIERSRTVALPNTVCPLCGRANRCAPASTGSLDVPCWCTQASISRAALARIPADLVDKACLCPRCAGVVDAQENLPPGGSN